MSRRRDPEEEELFCKGCQKHWFGKPGQCCPNPYINNGCDGHLVREMRTSSFEVTLDQISTQADEELWSMLSEQGFDPKSGQQYRITIEQQS